ncbi:MAG: hypothetical protein ABI743_12210, partial [bacterium]
MRNICWYAIVGAATMALMGCSGTSAPTNPEGAALPAAGSNGFVDPSGLVTANAGMFQIDANVITGKTTVTPLASRQGSAIGDLFFLKVNQFGLGLSDVTVENYDPIGETVEIHYNVAHAFGAPTAPAG